MYITLKIALFKDKDVRIGRVRDGIPGFNLQQSKWVLLMILEMMVEIARKELRLARVKGRKLSPLYKSGVRYAREQRTEIWKDPIETYKDGFGDCEDLSIWRTAELRNNHKRAEPYLTQRRDPKTGMYIFHVTVKRADGRIEDPSRILGMTGRD